MTHQYESARRVAALCRAARPGVIRYEAGVGVVREDPQVVSPLAKLGGELQQPAKAVRSLEGSTARAADILQFSRHVGRGEAQAQRSARLGRESRAGKGPGESRQEPMTVHGRMPVVTPVKRRGELARRPRILIGLKHVRQLVRVFPVHAVECQPGKACRRRLVNLDRRWLHLDGLHCLRWRLQGHADHE